MSDEINVIVVKRNGLNLYLRYIDPVDAKRRAKNSRGTTSMKAAQRAAGEWQAELRAGTGARAATKWSVFTEAYDQPLASLCVTRR